MRGTRSARAAGPRLRGAPAVGDLPSRGQSGAVWVDFAGGTRSSQSVAVWEQLPVCCSLGVCPNLLQLGLSITLPQINHHPPRALAMDRRHEIDRGSPPRRKKNIEQKIG